MCLPSRLLISVGVIGIKLCTIEFLMPIWLNKFYRLYMVAMVDIICRHGLTIEAHHKSQPNMSKLALCKP